MAVLYYRQGGISVEYDVGIGLKYPVSPTVTSRTEHGIAGLEQKFSYSAIGSPLEYGSASARPDPDFLSDFPHGLRDPFDFNPLQLKVDGNRGPIVIGGTLDADNIALQGRVGLGHKDANIYLYGSIDIDLFPTSDQLQRVEIELVGPDGGVIREIHEIVRSSHGNSVINQTIIDSYGTQVFVYELAEDQVQRYFLFQIEREAISHQLSGDLAPEGIAQRNKLDFVASSNTDSSGHSLEDFLASLGPDIAFASNGTALASGYDGLVAWDTDGDGNLDSWLDPLTGQIAATNYRGRTPGQEEQAQNNLDWWKDLLGLGDGGSGGSGLVGSTSSGSSSPSKPSGTSSQATDPKKPKDSGLVIPKEIQEAIENYNSEITAKPILLDLDGDGIQITELSQSHVFMDADNDGLLNQIAWAAAGNGVLFYDADGDGTISETREFIFTEWDPTAGSDLEALASVFDTNGDGVLDANDAAYADFKVMITNGDGTFSVQTLAELGITSIDLNPDATHIELPDGSVITGQTTFTWADGTTGTVGDVKLSYDAESHRVEQSSATDGSGNLVLTTTGYDIDGSVAFEYVSKTSPDGSLVENSYDDNGDGVVDRLQSIEIVSNPDGSETKTVTNSVGSDPATAVLVNLTVTHTDGDVVTISRDSTGGGWFDQVEVQTTHADGSRTLTVEELSFDGTVIQSTVETVSSDGLTRTEVIDRDGDGVTDLTITHQITVNVDGSRTEVTQVFNADGSLQSATSETTSADGTVRTVEADMDGDGVFESETASTITVHGDGSTTSVIESKNDDGSINSTTTQTQSDDALTKSNSHDLDGDGDVDLTVVDETVVHADGSRTSTVTQTNGDGSVHSMVEEHLGADQTSYEMTVDLDHDGVLETDEVVKTVTVDATTGEKTTTIWDRNPDGSVKASVVSVVSADGLSTTSDYDEDGDGDIDRTVTDITVLGTGGQSTRTITTTNQDGSLRSEVVVETSADGLSTTTTTDSDGDGVADSVVSVTRAQAADGSRTTVTERYAGDGATLLFSETLTESADRRLITREVDEDGDGIHDFVSVTSIGDDGTQTITGTVYFDDGGVKHTSTSVVSGDGLTRTVVSDRDGDGINESETVKETVLNADGSQTTTMTVFNGDGSLRTCQVVQVSDDGFVTTTSSDVDGDGAFESVAIATTSVASDGTVTTTTETQSGDGTTLGISEVSVSGNGLITVERQDTDGDGNFDLSVTSTTTLLSDGGQEVVTETRDSAGELRSVVTVTQSHDGREVTLERDFNGDGHVDQVELSVTADDGTITTTVTDYALDGSIESQSVTTTEATGLIASTETDVDGDGVVDQVTTTTTALNVDGSTTTTTEQTSNDGTVIAGSVYTVSDDGQTTVTQTDLDGDGSAEFVTTATTDVDVSGVTTSQTQTQAEDGSLISEVTSVVSADGNTMTETRDVDGNGIDDVVSTTIVQADGSTQSTVEYFSEGGGDLGSVETLTSGDGLYSLIKEDTNGDGRADLITVDQTVLGANGSVTRTIEYRDGFYQTLGSEVHYTSDDGTSQSISYDMDGDGVFEFISSQSTEILADGTTIVTVDGTAHMDPLATREVTTTSGDGLSVQIQTDADGDYAFDRVESITLGVDGGYVHEVSQYGEGAWLSSFIRTTVSADELTTLVEVDLDGDGDIDQDYLVEVQADQSVVGTYRDLDQFGQVESEIVTTTSANGMEAVTTFDVDGDGTVDYVQTVAHGIDEAGATTSTETVTSANGTVLEQNVVSTSANGLVQTSSFDSDGDGEVDGSQITQTIHHEDGSQTVETIRSYSDGTLHSEGAVTTNADGSSVESSFDFDGNGIDDKVITSSTSVDGERVEVHQSFGEAGALNSTFTTTTSADGLTVTTVRDTAFGEDIIETWSYSVAGSDSYIWESGIAVPEGQIGVGNISSTTPYLSSEHQIDANGIETWTFTRITYDEQGNPLTETFEARLDAATKDGIFEDAARIFDTVLDRDMDSAEREGLVEFIIGGQLDQAALANHLIDGPEYGTRFTDGETLSDADFLAQLYINSFGRAPSLLELAEGLSSLSGSVLPGEPLPESLTRAELAVQIAQSSEHVVIGNGHNLTNNFDVIRNPAAFERFLDKTYVEGLVTDLIDVAYDRDPTTQELVHLTELLMEGTETLTDIAALLLDLDGSLSGVASNSLSGLSGTDLILAAFENAYGRAPSADELATWEHLLTQNLITEAEFVASLSQSPEHQATNNGHIAVGPTVAVQHIGSAAAETHIGTGDDVDHFVGGEGDDTLIGGNGSDVYVWSKGDGDDRIDDNGDALIETDQLVLSDVTSDDVRLIRDQGSNDLLIEIISTGEKIEVGEQFQYSDKGDGIEEIVFGDGEVWFLDDIEAQTVVEGGDSNDTLTGQSSFNETFEGGLGDDSIAGGDGDDQITGGAGADSVDGGNGSDRFIWSVGDGPDVIQDTGYGFSEFDTLVLNGVHPADLTLEVSENSEDLLIHIEAGSPATTTTITIEGQFALAASGNGIETIEFADGTLWTLTDISAATGILGDSEANTLSGTVFGDNLYGGAEDDTLSDVDHGGDDTFYGGQGDDTLEGKHGADTYVWSQGDGNDQIIDDIPVPNWSGGNEPEAHSSALLDRLVLTDVGSGGVVLKRESGSKDLLITIIATGEVIRVTNQFDVAADGDGIEFIEFSDGVVWGLDDIQAFTAVSGGNANDTLIGAAAFSENFFGGAGQDVIYGGAGADLMDGGAGADTFFGGAGSDTIVYELGDGNDVVHDDDVSLTYVDAIEFVDITSSDVNLAQSGNDLVIGLTDGSSITVEDRFADAATGVGVEVLAFSDGVIVEVLSQTVAQTNVIGTVGADNLSGWGFTDNIFGDDGNDTLDGNGGNDTLVGGAGNDILWGDGGSDTYVWSIGDGDDVVDDNPDAFTDTDTLVLTDVTPEGVKLTRSNGTDDLLVTIVATGEVITIKEQFQYVDTADGIEAIQFADGTIWSLLEILENTWVEGTDSAEQLNGQNWFNENFNGGDGDDRINANGGNDTLIGGLGVDTLWGDEGSDTYVWSKGDGNDVIDDNENSFSETDTILLRDVLSDDVELTRTSGTDDLLVTILSTGEVILVKEQYNNPDNADGIEAIEFADGTIWAIGDIYAQTWVKGTADAERLDGRFDYHENFFGGLGNDTIDANDGDDTLIGGAGDDTLWGDDGSDTYVWAKGDGNDIVDDNADDLYDVDTLELTDVASTGVSLSVASGTDDLLITILSTGEVITVKEQFMSSTLGDGIEAIKFSDGVIWFEPDIIANTSMTGSTAADTLSGSNLSDQIFGLEGHDTLYGGADDDSLFGGSGNDYLLAGNQDDIIFGGDGTDTLNGGSGHDTLVGGLGADILYGGSGSEDIASYATSSASVVIDLLAGSGTGGDAEGDTLSNVEGVLGSDHADHLTGNSLDNWLDGGAGNDTIFGGGGHDTLLGGLGDNELHGGEGGDTVIGGVGFDNVWLDDGHDIYDGTSSNAGSPGDIVRGGNGADTIYGGSGDDRFWGNNGSDLIHGGAGDDLIYGGFGDDVVEGGQGKDLISGYVGDDTMMGGAGADVFVFDTGVNHGHDIIVDFALQQDTLYLEDLDLSGVTLSATANTTTLTWSDGEILLSGVTVTDLSDLVIATSHLDGTNSADNIDGTSLGELVYLEGGDDRAEVKSGTDVVFGGAGADTILGGGGNDLVYGGLGDDDLHGGNGDDVIEGGEGDDMLKGNSGADTFVFGDTVPSGSDTIRDFEVGTDLMEIAGVTFSDLTVTTVGNHLNVSWSNGDVTLNNLAGQTLDEDDFVFL